MVADRSILRRGVRRSTWHRAATVMGTANRFGHHRFMERYPNECEMASVAPN